MAARNSAIRCSSAACPQSLVPTSVSSGQNCWRTVSRCGQVWRMCSGVCSSEPHSQWAESARPSLFRCFPSPQWPECRWKMVVWALLSRVLIWSFCGDRLVGLVVRRPPWERKTPGSNPACDGIFLGSSHTSDSKIGTPVATLPGAWRYRVSAGTGQPGVSILWLGGVESWICNFYLSVAARKLVRADPSLRYTCMLLGR